MNTLHNPSRHWQHSALAHSLVIGCGLLYAGLSLFASRGGNPAFHLSNLQTIFMQLTIVIPVIVIWLVALRGAITFKVYANLIKGSPEAAGINRIADGLFWTVIYLICIALTGAAVPYFSQSPQLPLVLLIRNHAPVLAALVAFILIYAGSHQLRQITPFTTWTRTTIWLMVAFSLFSLFIALVFIQTPTPVDSRGIPNSTLPREVLLFSVLLPYLSAWLMGLLASVNIAKYAKRVNGIIYRAALQDLVRGIVAVVAFGILLQLLTLASRFLVGLSLAPLLLIIYTLLAFYGLGFWFVRSGAKKLTRMEVA